MPTRVSNQGSIKGETPQVNSLQTQETQHLVKKENVLASLTSLPHKQRNFGKDAFIEKVPALVPDQSISM